MTTGTIPQEIWEHAIEANNKPPVYGLWRSLLAGGGDSHTLPILERTVFGMRIGNQRYNRFAITLSGEWIALRLRVLHARTSNSPMRLSTIF